MNYHICSVNPKLMLAILEQTFIFLNMRMKYFGKNYHTLGDFIGPNHEIALWDMCLVIYEGLNEETRMVWNL